MQFFADDAEFIKAITSIDIANGMPLNEEKCFVVSLV